MFPKMILVRQNDSCSEEIKNIPETLADSLKNAGFDPSDFKGRKTGIAVGSRGISHETEVVRYLVDYIKAGGGYPEIFAAMGCHGEASPEGQREVLYSLGFSEEAMGCSIASCADSKVYGSTESGLTVIGNTLPFKYDAIILINRIKMHTDFSDRTESGLMKLCAIGIGNPGGCNNVHRYALRLGYGPVIRETARLMMEKLPVVLGIALTENWRHKLDHIEAIRPENIPEREEALLAAVKKQNKSLPAKELDALIVGEIGKDISGTGMDTKVIGRIRIVGQKEPESPRIKRIGVINISEASHGNAIGIGLADFAPLGLLDKINIRATSINGWSSMCPEQAGLPCLLDTERDVFEQSVKTTGIEDPEKARVIYIQNTNSLSVMAVSESLYEDELKKRPDIEKISEAFDIEFDEDGKLLSVWDKGNLSTGA